MRQFPGSQVAWSAGDRPAGGGAAGAADCALRCRALRGGGTPRDGSTLGTRRALLLPPGPGVVLLSTACALPDLARGRGMLARALGFTLGLFQALARALQLLLRDAHALLGDFRLQPCPLQRLGRGVLFAACLLHRWARDAKGAQSHISARRLPPRDLSTEFVHNHVDRRGACR